MIKVKWFWRVYAILILMINVFDVQLQRVNLIAWRYRRVAVLFFTMK